MQPNDDTQVVNVKIKAKDYLKGDLIRVDVHENYRPNSFFYPLYDSNKNLVIQNNRGYLSFMSP